MTSYYCTQSQRYYYRGKIYMADLQYNKEINKVIMYENQND